MWYSHFGCRGIAEDAASLAGLHARGVACSHSVAGAGARARMRGPGGAVPRTQRGGAFHSAGIRTDALPTRGAPRTASA